ncbi:MAG: glycosyl [Bacteroidetes bacterium]|nr:MAG: glycosyl [Bacteroidota bacterium]
MENQPLVSVIMPVYNGAKTIKLALNSLINQAYQNWICIIVNDGSTDNTKDILDSLQDKRFRVIHLKKNVGRGAARQVALDHTEGDFLAYLDADDFYHTGKLQKQVEILSENKAISLVGCRIFCFDSNYSPMSTRGSGLKQPIPFKYGDILRLVMPSAMIRLPDAKKCKYNSRLNAAEDVDYFSRYLNNKVYINIPDILLYYSVTESTTYRKILEYTGYEILRGFTMLGRNNLAAIRTIFSTSAKWLLYATAIPLTGINFFLNRRGKIPEMNEIECFEKQKLMNKLINVTNEKTL